MGTVIFTLKKEKKEEGEREGRGEGKEKNLKDQAGESNIP